MLKNTIHLIFSSLLLLFVFCSNPPTAIKTEKKTVPDSVQTELPQIVKEYLFYKEQICRNYPKIQPYIDSLARFDSLNAVGKPISKEAFQQYVVALITQESNFIQKKYDGTILKSYANAVGVGQFTEEGVKAVNNYLNKKRDSTKKKNKKNFIFQQYINQKDVNFALLQDTGQNGLHEGFRAACLLSKIQLQRHTDSWKFAAIEYNSGRIRKGSYHRAKRRIPRETRDYVERMEQHMKQYDKGNYLRYLLLRWGVVMIELENMYGNKAIKKDELEEAKRRYENAIVLNEYLIQHKLDTLMRYHDNIILHANYELGNIKVIHGDTLASLNHYYEVLKVTNKKKRYEYRNAKFSLYKLKASTNDSATQAFVDEIIEQVASL